MAHVTSYKVGGAIGVLKHDERSEHDHVQERKNESIDNSRTNLNYNMAAKRSGTLMQHIKRVCDENNVRLSNRKDLNVMCSWVVTAPKTVKPAELSLFFKTCYDFLQNKYGKQYTLSATVHMDETTPHLHYCFLPVGLDQKNDRLTVSSKLVLSRSHLRTFHKELESELERVFGRELGIENGATKEGNQTVEQLKQQSALAAEIEQQQQKLQHLDTKICQRQVEVERLNSDISVLEARTATLTRKEVKSIDTTPKRLTGGFKGLSPEQAQQLVNTDERHRSKIKKLQEENKKLKNQNEALKISLDKAQAPLSKNTVLNARKITDKENQLKLFHKVLGLSDEANYADCRKALKVNGLLLENKKQNHL